MHFFLALKVLADLGGIDATAARRDPGMSSAARARAANSLSSLGGGAGGAAAAGAAALLRL